MFFCKKETKIKQKKNDAYFSLEGSIHFVYIYNGLVVLR